MCGRGAGTDVEVIDVTAQEELRRRHPEMFTEPIMAADAETMTPTRSELEADYVNGRAFISELLLAGGAPDKTELLRGVVGPLRIALLAEHEPVTASARMLVEAAATSYGDWALYTNLLHRLLDEPGMGASVQAYKRLAEGSLKTAMMSLDMLRRPNRPVKISVGAAHVNVGVQVALPKRARRRR